MLLHVSAVVWVGNEQKYFPNPPDKGWVLFFIQYSVEIENVGWSKTISSRGGKDKDDHRDVNRDQRNSPHQ